jgi:hypothetical protein
MANESAVWAQACIPTKRGRILMDDLHKSLSEGEGARSLTSDGRSHLPRNINMQCLCG